MIIGLHGISAIKIKLIIIIIIIMRVSEFANSVNSPLRMHVGHLLRNDACPGGGAFAIYSKLGILICIVRSSL